MEQIKWDMGQVKWEMWNGTSEMGQVKWGNGAVDI